MGDHDPAEPVDEAGEVSVEEGLVIVDGPGGVALTLTPAAARVWGERLIAAAADALQ